MNIKYKKIYPPTVLVYDENDKLVAEMNEYEFNDFRIQIKRNKASGYYVVERGNRHPINSNGSMAKHPVCFWLVADQLDELTQL